MSDSVQLSFPWIQQRGVREVGGIRNFWHMNPISAHPFSLSFAASPFVFLFAPLSVVEQKDKETCMALPVAEPSGNVALKLPSALCQPAGGP